MVNVSDEAGQARWVADQVLAQREAGATLKSQAALFRSASHSAALELELTRRNIPFVKFGGLRFLEAAHIKDLLSLLRWAENPRGRMAGFRVAQLLPGVGPATAGKLMDAMSASAEPLAALRAFKPGAAAQGLGRLRRHLCRAARSRAEMARRRGPGLALVCGPARTAVRRCARAPRRPGTTGPHRGRLSVARTLPDRADARSSRRHQRRIARAAARGLHDPVHHPFRQGTGMEIRVCAERGGRLHSVGHEHRHGRGNRGRTPPAVRRHDPRANACSWSCRSVSTCISRPAWATGMYASRTRFITNAMLPLFDHLPKAPPLPEGNAAGAGHRCGASGAGPVFLVRFQPSWVKNSPTRLGAFKESSLVGR